HPQVRRSGTTLNVRAQIPLVGSPRGGRPFGARRGSASQEIDRSDSPLRVRYARSVTCELALSVHAAMAGGGISTTRSGSVEHEWRAIPRRAERPPERGEPTSRD